MERKNVLWLKEWFDGNVESYINRLTSTNNPEEIKEILWDYLRYAQTSAYGKGRVVGIDFAIRKYRLKEWG